MNKKRFPLICLLATSLFLVPSTGSAASISGTSIEVTSVFNGKPAQHFTFANITATRIDGGIFSDWMVGADNGTNLEFIPGPDNGDQTRNEFDLNFSGDELYDNFSPADVLTLTFQLDPNLEFNTNFMAITIANDTQVPSSYVNGGTLSLDITGLDQIAGQGGQLQLIFDVEAVPEPSTFLMALPIFAVLLFSLRRRRAAAITIQNR